MRGRGRDDAPLGIVERIGRQARSSGARSGERQAGIGSGRQREMCREQLGIDRFTEKKQATKEGNAINETRT